MSGKRILLLAVAGLLSATALLAIAILLGNGFGGSQWKILGTTGFLAGYALVALPAAASEAVARASLRSRPWSSRTTAGRASRA